MWSGGLRAGALRAVPLCASRGCCAAGLFLQLLFLYREHQKRAKFRSVVWIILQNIKETNTIQILTGKEDVPVIYFFLLYAYVCLCACSSEAGIARALYTYQAQSADELSFQEGALIRLLRCGQGEVCVHCQCPATLKEQTHDGPQRLNHYPNYSL